MLVGKLEECHAASIALLLYLMGSEDRLDRNGGMRANTLRPRDEAICVPLDKFLMVLRHVIFYGTVLPRFSIEARVGAYSIIIVEDFNNVASHSDIYPMLDIFIGNGVVHFLNAYMIIELDSGGLPGRQLIWGSRQ